MPPVLLLVALAGCSSSESVDWDNYPPAIHDAIDAAAEAGDCQELQDEFAWAKDHDASQEVSFGDGNADLMAYINDKADGAGCFPEGTGEFR